MRTFALLRPPRNIINNEVVLITDASNEIGLTLAEQLAKENYIVFAATASNPENAIKLQALKKRFSNVFIIQLTANDNDQKIKSIIHSIGEINILINNANINLYGLIETEVKVQTDTAGNIYLTGLPAEKMRDKTAPRISRAKY